MSSLVIAQTNNAGVGLSATVNDTTTTNIVVTFVSSTYDAAGSVDKSFAATSAAPGSFVLTDEDLITLFGNTALNNMKQNGSLSPAVSMSASQFDASGVEVEEALTTIDGLNNNRLSYLQFALPGAPVEESVGLGDGKLTIEVNVESKNDVSNQIKLTVHKTATDDGLGEITNSTVTGTHINRVGAIHTYTFVATDLENAAVYEIFARFANIGPDGTLQYGPKNTVAFVGEPNTLPGACSDLSSATVLDLEGKLVTDNAVTVGARWTKTDTDPEDSKPNVYKMIVSYGDSAIEVAQPAALDVSAGTVVVLESATIPHTWFTNSTSISVTVAIKQYYSKSDPVVGNTQSIIIHRMVMPTLSTAITVDADGNQKITPTTGYTGAGSPVLIADFAGDQTGNLGNSNELVISYDNIVAAGDNNTVSFTYTVQDKNGSNDTYSVTDSTVLYAFKNPAPPKSPTLSISGIESDPVIEFEKAINQYNNGWTIDHYVVNVEYVGPNGGLASYENPYDASFAYGDISSSIVATQNTSNAYIAGNYKAKITSVFSVGEIPDHYEGLYTLPDSMSSESTAERWWTRPTISDIVVSGKNMIITGNNGGASYSSDAVTSIGFVAGDQDIEDDYSMSKVTGNMSAGSIGLAVNRSATDLFNFTVSLTHDADLKDLSGDYLDGLGFVDADNAPSALSIAVFNTSAIGDLATTVQGALKLLEGELAGLEGTRDGKLLEFDDVSGNLAQAIIDLSNAEGLKTEKAGVLTATAQYTISGEILTLTLEGAAQKFSDISDAAVSFANTKEGLVPALQTIFDDASGNLALAEAEVTRLSNEEYTVANHNAYNEAVETRNAADVSFNDASGVLVAAQSAATNARSYANSAVSVAYSAIEKFNTATREFNNAAGAVGTKSSERDTLITNKSTAKDEYDDAQKDVDDKKIEIGQFAQQVATQDLDTAIADARILAQRAILKSN